MNNNSLIIKTTDQFIERFASVVPNFKWQENNGQICGWRKDLLYDPLTAYVQIAKGIYIERHHSEKIPLTISINEDLFKKIMYVLYGFYQSHEDCVEIRDRLLKVTGLTH